MLAWANGVQSGRLAPAMEPYSPSGQELFLFGQFFGRDEFVIRYVQLLAAHDHDLGLRSHGHFSADGFGSPESP